MIIFAALLHLVAASVCRQCATVGQTCTANNTGPRGVISQLTGTFIDTSNSGGSVTGGNGIIEDHAGASISMANGIVDNNAGGTISGGANAIIDDHGGGAVVSNGNGIIQNSAGAIVQGDGIVQNSAGGSISGNGIIVNNAGGMIAGTAIIENAGGGDVTGTGLILNSAGGQIEGLGIIANNSGADIMAGTIEVLVHQTDAPKVHESDAVIDGPAIVYGDNDTIDGSYDIAIGQNDVIHGTGIVVGSGIIYGTGIIEGNGTVDGTGIVKGGQDGHVDGLGIVDAPMGSVYGEGIVNGSGTVVGEGIINGAGTIIGSGIANNDTQVLQCTIDGVDLAVLEPGDFCCTPAPVTCSLADEAQPCCNDPANAGMLQCNASSAGGGDDLVSTDNERCHAGVCVGCITASSLVTTNALCGPTFNFGFLTDADIAEEPLGICAIATRLARNVVLIANWTVVGDALPNIDQAYLDQFDSVFSFKVYGDRYIELQCLPTSEHHCHVSSIRFGSFGNTFCWAEFDVGDKRKRDTSPLDDDRVIGGTLLEPNPLT